MMKNKIDLYMGLDIGDATIGIAFSDALGITAQGYETYSRQSKKLDIDYIVDLIVLKNIDCVVFGLPILLNGDVGEQAVKTLNFVKTLEKKLKYSDKVNKIVSVKPQDERFTSAQADSIMREASISRKKRAENVDKLAAVLILENYMRNLEYSNLSK